MTVKSASEHVLKREEALDGEQTTPSGHRDHPPQLKTPKRADENTASVIITRTKPRHRRIPWGKNERIVQTLTWLYHTFPSVFKASDRLPLKVNIL